MFGVVLVALCLGLTAEVALAKSPSYLRVCEVPPKPEGGGTYSVTADGYGPINVPIPAGATDTQKRTAIMNAINAYQAGNPPAQVLRATAVPNTSGVMKIEDMAGNPVSIGTSDSTGEAGDGTLAQGDYDPADVGTLEYVGEPTGINGYDLPAIAVAGVTGVGVVDVYTAGLTASEVMDALAIALNAISIPAYISNGVLYVPLEDGSGLEYGSDDLGLITRSHVD